MNRKAVWVSLLSLGFGVALAAQDPQPPPRQDPQPPPKQDVPRSMPQDAPKGMSVNGQVTSIDAKAGTLVVKAEAMGGTAAPHDMSFTIGPKTKILKDGKAANLADLKAGDRVAVEYESSSGKNMALVIGVVLNRTT
jgi:Cu/Ag efflux protein CusF